MQSLGKPRFEGVVLTTSYLHVADVGGDYYDFEAKRVVFGKNEGGRLVAPLTRIRKTFFPAFKIDGELLPAIALPDFPANSVRGRLRRKAYKIIREYAKKKGIKLSREAVHVFLCGAESGQPNETQSTFNDLRKARNNIYLGLFGGSPAMFEANLCQEPMWPVCHALAQRGFLPKSVLGMVVEPMVSEENGRIIYPERGFTDVKMFRRVDDALNHPGEFFDVIEDPAQALEAWLQRLDDNKANKKASEEFNGDKAPKESLQGWSAIEVVNPGVPFLYRADGEMTDAQMGLMIMALRLLIAEQPLGGKIAWGFGRYKASYFRVILPDGTEGIITDRYGEFVENDPVVTRLVAAAEAELEDFDFDWFQGVCIRKTKKSTDKPAKEKKGKKGQETAAGEQDE